MKTRFTYYLHDGYNSMEFKELLEEQTDLDVEITDELMQKIGRPFYEVTLICELDTETGAVTLLEANL